MQVLRRVLGVAVLIAGLGACSTSKVPVFDNPRSIGPGILVLKPEVRLGPSSTPSELDLLAEQLTLELRRALAGTNLDVAVPSDPARVAPLREALRDVLDRRRAESRALRPGAELALDEALTAPAKGSETVAFALLSRLGGTGDDSYVPRRADEIVPRPEDRYDYVIPQAGNTAYSNGVHLELVVIDAMTSRVLVYRRVAHPASTVADIRAALPVLVREASRNISRSPGQ